MNKKYYLVDCTWLPKVIFESQEDAWNYIYSKFFEQYKERYAEDLNEIILSGLADGDYAKIITRYYHLIGVGFPQVFEIYLENPYSEKNMEDIKAEAAMLLLASMSNDF